MTLQQCIVSRHPSNVLLHSVLCWHHRQCWTVSASWPGSFPTSLRIQIGEGSSGPLCLDRFQMNRKRCVTMVAHPNTGCLHISGLFYCHWDFTNAGPQTLELRNLKWLFADVVWFPTLYHRFLSFLWFSSYMYFQKFTTTCQACVLKFHTRFSSRIIFL